MKSRVGDWINARLERRASLRAGIALVYHVIGDPPGDPRYELTPALATRLFESQLQYLSKHYRVVPPSQLVDAARARRAGDRFPVAITFDDDLASHLEVVVPALRRAKLPAAFFVCGASLDGARSFWWEDLQALAERRDGGAVRLRSLPELDLTAVVRGVPYAIHDAAEFIERLPAARLDAVAAELRAFAKAKPPHLTATDLRALADAGFEIGFHTRRHYLLTTLDEGELRTAMTDGRAELEAVIGRPLRMIAYPHGKADARVAAASRSAGYDLAFTASPEAVGPSADAFMLGRAEALSHSPRRFAQMIASVLRAEPG